MDHSWSLVYCILVKEILIIHLIFYLLTMSTITWKVANLDRTLADGRVSTVHYTVDARSDDEVYSAGAYGSLGLEGDVTTPYADLTEETVVGWVKAALGEEKVAEVVAALDAQLAEQATPTVGSGTPWS